MITRNPHTAHAHRRFAWRLARNTGLALLVVLFSLLIGMLGYQGFEDMPWVDALLNASMILGGMGPVSELHTEAGKIFASLYALYSGLVLIGVTGIILAPILHRVLHIFHAERDQNP